ncbi:AAA family ATPase [Achromobacter ruhlandii]|uniref:AAA family ATPase n=1 Tax=Achromobacter ruhlandii TaxID=72557 RepID=UPI000C25B57F|nr:AAA family ATPase [Achromobacter ruhlandii]PJM89066.1 chromosome segregation protein SMC [Achromobacter ruhlandii]
MIQNIEIRNYKSIEKISLPLGRVNLFIGENGAGKSNILEAIALGAAAASDKLDNEFLSTRGIRVTPAEDMRPAFADFSHNENIFISATFEDEIKASYELSNDNQPYSKWQCRAGIQGPNLPSLNEVSHKFWDYFSTKNKRKPNKSEKDLINFVIKSFGEKHPPKLKYNNEKNDEPSITITPDQRIFHLISQGWFVEEKKEPSLSFQDFMIYSPENSALKSLHREGQIEPLGVNGEGLLKLLSVLSSDPKYVDVYRDIRESLRLLGWFKDFEIISGDHTKNRIQIQDNFLEENRAYFDQMSANEGFLFLLFYFCLFSSELTPKFFAIDNIDSSLNPKLCQQLIKQLVSLSKTHNKQVILTTHNPAILDGLNLDDDSQRLFVVSRNRKGYTRIERIKKPNTDSTPIKLSAMFLNGMLGGLPKGF